MSVRHQHNQTSVSVDDFITIRQLTTSNTAFTEGGIRALIFRAKSNGFDSCIRRIGGRSSSLKVLFLIGLKLKMEKCDDDELEKRKAPHWY